MLARVLLVLSTAQAKLLDCDERLCPLAWVFPKQRGDGYCDLSCNTAPCGFDSEATDLKLFRYTESDCYSLCSLVKCFGATSYPTPCVTLGDFGNGVCKETVATAECGWDVGICGYCAYHCEL